MKLKDDNKQKSIKNGKNDHLWKKIGVAEKIVCNNQPSVEKGARFQTSLQWQMFLHENQDDKLRLQAKKGEEKNVGALDGKNQKINFFVRDKQIPLCSSRIKMVESMSNIEYQTKIQQNVRNRPCKECQPKLKTLLIPLNEQLNKIITHYNLIKQQINNQIKNYWQCMQNMIKNMHLSLSLSMIFFGPVQNMSHHALLQKLEMKKEKNQKLLWIDWEIKRRKEVISGMEGHRIRLKNQLKMLQKANIDIKYSLQSMNLFTTQIKQIKYQNENKNNNTLLLLTNKHQLSSQQSQDHPIRHKTTKTEAQLHQNEDQQSRQQIQKIKKKIQGLKLRLNKTRSEYYSDS